MIKIILEETRTNRGISGNVYHTVKIINVKNNKYFTVSTPSLSNVDGILKRFMNLQWDNIYSVVTYTNSARLSSLPTSLRLDCCRVTPEWKKELNKIGLRSNNK